MGELLVRRKKEESSMSDQKEKQYDGKYEYLIMRPHAMQCRPEKMKGGKGNNNNRRKKEKVTSILSYSFFDFFFFLVSILK